MGYFSGCGFSINLRQEIERRRMHPRSGVFAVQQLDFTLVLGRYLPSALRIAIMQGSAGLCQQIGWFRARTEVHLSVGLAAIANRADQRRHSDFKAPSISI